MSINVAIIGGGVAGVTAALTLSNLGLNVTIFEANNRLISGPPFCHLHAGGNLYREISDRQCLTLLEQSIDFAKLYPFAIDKRPTIFATPIYDKQEPTDIVNRLELLKSRYQELINKDISNKQLSDANNYYELFTKEQLEEIAKKEIVKEPKENIEWLIPFAKNLDFSKIKFPVIVVQEYGINLFRVAASAALALESLDNVNLYRDTKVTDVKYRDGSYEISFVGKESGSIEADYLINAAGFKTGIIDDMLNIKEQRLVEFKAAYTTKWKDRCDKWPEVVFHGERGTSKGMGQFTPYCSGIVQLHAMTPDVTLFKDGLVSTNSESSYPKLNSKFLDIIDSGWSKDLRDKRAKKAVEYLSNFFPKFADATFEFKPLFGAQQIPGDDPTLRVAEVSFAKPKYARCEIVKVSSVNDMAKAIVEDIAKEFNLEFKEDIFNIEALKNLSDSQIDARAKKIAKIAEYPEEMAKRCNRLWV